MGLMNLNHWTPIVKEAFQASVFAAKFLCCLHVTNTYICTFALTQGPSMLPTFNLTGALILAERLSPQFGKVGTGDVVLVQSPENPRKIVTKRVVGVGGDTVTYIVNPQKSVEKKTVVVPEGNVWIEGDNIYNTNDSRKFGPVPYGLVQGRVFWVVWPREDFGSVRKKGQ